MINQRHASGVDRSGARVEGHLIAVSPNPPAPEEADTGLYLVAPATGRCEVVVYSDDHFATFADLPPARIRMIIDVWADRWQTLAAEPAVKYVMPFENKGEVVGTTLSHPHGQIYAFPDIPPRSERELRTAGRYRKLPGAASVVMSWKPRYPTGAGSWRRWTRASPGCPSGLDSPTRCTSPPAAMHRRSSI
jgi:hypothetical protein